MRSMKGQVALLTAAGTETTRAAALRLSAAGMKVAVCAPLPETADALAREINQLGGEALPFGGDLGNQDFATEVVQLTLNHYGCLDCLVINAATWGGGLIHEHSVKTWDLILTENLRAPFLLLHAALPHFRQQQHGDILLLTSESALQSYERDGSYGVALHGVLALFEEARLENAAAGIRVQTLITSLVQSNGQGIQAQDIADWVQWLLQQPQNLQVTAPVVLIEKP